MYTVPIGEEEFSLEELTCMSQPRTTPLLLSRLKTTTSMYTVPIGEEEFSPEELTCMSQPHTTP